MSFKHFITGILTGLVAGVVLGFILSIVVVRHLLGLSVLSFILLAISIGFIFIFRKKADIQTKRFIMGFVPMLSIMLTISWQLTPF